MKEKQICKNCGKEKIIHAYGYCGTCYQRLLYNGLIGGKHSICKIEGCDKISRAKGYCSRHYHQIYRTGSILEINTNRTIMDKNEIIIKDDHAEIILYDKKCYEKARALIDIEDIEKVKDIKWNCEINLHIHNNNIWLHRLVMNCTDDNLVVDHINHNPLDNRKCNLRICTPKENGMNHSLHVNNTTGIIGLYYNKDKNTWKPNITVDGKVITLGEFIDKDEAIKERLKAEVYYMKEFAPQQYLYEEYGIDKNAEYEVKQNKPKKQGNNYGITGVFKGSGNNEGKWKVEFTKDKKRIYLGYYDTLEEAIEVRQAYQ